MVQPLPIFGGQKKMPRQSSVGAFLLILWLKIIVYTDYIVISGHKIKKMIQ